MDLDVEEFRSPNFNTINMNVVAHGVGLGWNEKRERKREDSIVKSKFSNTNTSNHSFQFLPFFLSLKFEMNYFKK